MALFRILVLAVLLVGGGGLLWWRCEGERPEIVAPEKLGVGREARKVALEVSDERSGLRRVRVALRHGGGEAVLLERDDFPGGLLRGGIRGARERLELSIDGRALGLAEGQATLQVEALDWSWRSFLSGNRSEVAVPVTVDLTPPRLRVETGLTYLQRGGSGAVVYRLGDGVERDGVEVGDLFFPGNPFPGPGAPERRLAIFAIPRDGQKDPAIRVVAADDAGNVTRVPWATNLKERRFPDERIDLTPNFLAVKVPELAASVGVTEADPVAAFQKINREVRAANEARVREIVARSDPEKHWDGAFEQLANSKVTSRFAEHRSYFVQSQQVSEAIHFGYDLAALATSPITASNAGRVAFAGDLGIYGSCVILDHGVGVWSLYGHLSSIDVAEGDRVTKGQVLGMSGATGLAGGDHLHFAILVGGQYVDPVEWWDPKWVREKVEAQLEPPAAPAGG